MSLFEILSKYSPPLTEAQVRELALSIAGELERQLDDLCRRCEADRRSKASRKAGRSTTHG